MHQAGRPESAKGAGQLAGTLDLGAPVLPSDRPTATFVVDGQPFCFAGTNNYYLTYKSRRMIDDVLEATNRMGLKVVRIWANIDRGSLDGSVKSVDGAGDKDGVYFQYWDVATQRPAYNDGASGLQHLDYVIAAAARLGLKVMLVLTNNWREFGGMDQYVAWFGLTQHHAFYTDPRARAAYRRWAAHLALRRNSIGGVLYRDDPAIFGWELANEPRCWNGGDFDDRSQCSSKALVSWAEEMSGAIKSVDPNHLVSIGDEGFFAQGTEWGYDGSDGVDHEALLGLSHVDFGTFHLYPDTWQRSLSWSRQWIEDHIAAARRAGKPTMLEEYGVATGQDGVASAIDAGRRTDAFRGWHEVIQKRGGNAALFWMLAGHDDSNGEYPDYDHFAIYEKDGVASALRAFAWSMTTSARACALYRSLVPADGVARTPFVTTAPPPSSTGALVER
ncbi:MAG: cellulase family glycosylhydrolase [Polyangiaceae bacterium]|jgi:mannan endo-1,4-beta-mannosidase